MRFWRHLWRSCRLRCPRCGADHLFVGAFRLRPECRLCGLHFTREPGFYLGSIYFNYGLTALIVTVVYVTAFVVSPERPGTWLLWLLVGFCVAFPLWFFRYARSLWLGFDQWRDPREGEFR